MFGSKRNASELRNDDFFAIRDFIHEKSGIYIADNRKYIVENRLARRMSELGVKSYKDYFYLVKYDSTLKEFNQLMNLVTTNETSFFRSESQLRAFSDEILPGLMNDLAGSGRRNVRIWSAGCSTGEEPYTIAMLLLEKIESIRTWQFEIVANDISEQVIASARRGIYGESALRTTERRVIDKYFSREPEGYRVCNEVRQFVKFSHLNLVDSKRVSMFRDFDIIFCRNVLMYFSDDAKIATVRQFYNSLRPGGYLIIGHSESLHNISKAFKLSYLSNALVYRRENIEGLSSNVTARQRFNHDDKTSPVRGAFPKVKTQEAMEKILAARK